MKYYLEIPLTLIASLLITNGWVMKPLQTVYNRNDGQHIVVVDAKWIDSMQVKYYYDSGRQFMYVPMKIDSDITTQRYQGLNDSFFMQLKLADSELINAH